MVANYPYDDSDGLEGVPSRTPDDATFQHLSRTYASAHEYMHRGKGVCESDDFPGGITNGAQWYIVRGGMQDFNYVFSNCFEITVELSCCKYPTVGSIAKEWDRNRDSMLAYLEQGHLGAKGVVSDNAGKAVSHKVLVEVQGIDKKVWTTERGEYWRLLTPGSYRIRAIDPVNKYRYSRKKSEVFIPSPMGYIHFLLLLLLLLLFLLLLDERRKMFLLFMLLFFLLLFYLLMLLLSL